MKIIYEDRVIHNSIFLNIILYYHIIFNNSFSNDTDHDETI